MASISDFKANLQGGGARANHFWVNLSMPGMVENQVEAAREAQFLCHSAYLPASTLTDIPVLYQGRTVHLAGEREYSPWTVEIYNDIGFGIRDTFERWIEKMQNGSGTNGELFASNYQSQMQVHQLDRNGKTLKSYNFINVFPTELGEIALSYDQGNAIESFSVNFIYDYWQSNTTFDNTKT